MEQSESRQVSRKSDLALFVSTIAVFCLALVFFNPEKSLAFSILAGLVAAIVQDHNYESGFIFWLSLGIIVLIHIAIICIINIPHLKFGLIAMPFAMIDGFAMSKFLKWISQRSKKNRD